MTIIKIEFGDEAIMALTNLTTAIDALATAINAAEGVDAETDEPKLPKKAAAKKAAAKKAAEKEGPTVEEVRKTLKEYAAIEGKAAAIEILNETGGAASVGELDAEKYQAVIDKCEED